MKGADKHAISSKQLNFSYSILTQDFTNNLLFNTSIAAPHRNRRTRTWFCTAELNKSPGARRHGAPEQSTLKKLRSQHHATTPGTYFITGRLPKTKQISEIFLLITKTGN